MSQGLLGKHYVEQYLLLKGTFYHVQSKPL